MFSVRSGAERVVILTLACLGIGGAFLWKSSTLQVYLRCGGQCCLSPMLVGYTPSAFEEDWMRHMDTLPRDSLCETLIQDNARVEQYVGQVRLRTQLHL
jgi:hypothetical protein